MEEVTEIEMWWSRWMKMRVWMKIKGRYMNAGQVDKLLGGSCRKEGGRGD